MTDRDELHLMTGAYALNALDASEREEFENFLDGSEEARTEVAEMSGTAVLLGLSARPIAPSPELKTNLMALIASTPQLAPIARPRPVAVPTIAEQRSIRGLAADSQGRSGSGVSSGPAAARAQRRWYTKPVNLLVAAAAAVALFAGGSILGVNLGGNTYDQAQAKSLVELSSAQDLRQSTADIKGGGTAKLLWSADLKRSAMVVDSLPALSSDKVYQLWYINGPAVTSAGTFTASASGPSFRVLDGGLIAGGAVGLTVEPKGGSTTPTTTPLVVINDA